MKKLALILISAMILTACSNDNLSVNSGSNSSIFSSKIELSEAEKSSSESRLNAITDGVYTTYDKSKYENISAPKIYHAEFQEISEEFFFSLFSSEPKYSAEKDGYVTENECGQYKAPTENSDYYNLTYYTTTGFDSSALAANCFFEYSASSNLDFMPIDGVRSEFENLTNEILKTEIELNFYAISKSGKTLVGENKITPENWKGADEFYYITARQIVDGIPIFSGVVGGPHKGGYTYGPTIEAIFTENKFEYLAIFRPYKIGSVMPTDGEFITIEKAEEKIKSMYEELLTFEEVTFQNVELVYIPIYSSGELVLTPAWEFSDDFGPLYRINAYTGEEIR